MYLFCFHGRCNILHLLFFWCNLEYSLSYAFRWGRLLLGWSHSLRGLDHDSFIVSTARGKYLVAFEYVSPGHVSKFPLFIALNHVDLTGNPDAACLYLTSASTFGRSYALYTERVVCLLSIVWCISKSLVGFREKRHRLVSYFSLQTVRIGLPPGDNTITSLLVNKTVKSASHMGLTLTSVLVKDGMMYPVVG